MLRGPVRIIGRLGSTVKTHKTLTLLEWEENARKGFFAGGRRGGGDNAIFLESCFFLFWYKGAPKFCCILDTIENNSHLIQSI